MVVEGTVEARTTRAGEPEHDDEWLELARARIGNWVGGRLQLERVLGVGGTATVFAARHRNGRALAVKVLHAAFAHRPSIRQRFLAEGYAANKVDHPDAVAVLDEGEDAEGNVFIVMELLRGESLLERLQAHGPLAKGQVVSIALRVLDVLGRAHDRGVVHRDIKPGNLFQTEDGTIKVLDFGIARVEGGPGAFSTRPGTTLGTPAFMAPELAAGRLGELDALTDLWALGATMFQLLTGDTVHPSDTDMQLLVLAATRPARSLATLRPELEPWLVKVVDRALAFDRRARWPNARAMSAALSEPALRAGWISAHPGSTSDPSAIETAPEMALPPSRPAPRPPWSRVLSWALASLLVLAIAGSVLAIQRRYGYTPPKTSAVAPVEHAPIQIVSGGRASEERSDQPSLGGPPGPPRAVAPRPSASQAPPAARLAKAHPSAIREPAVPPLPSAQPANPLFFPRQ